MAKVSVKPQSVSVKLNPLEAFFGLHGSIDLWAPNVAGAQPLGKGWIWDLGMRMPGSAIPGLFVLGTFRRNGQSAYVSWTAGTEPLQINLTGHRFSRVVVGVPNAAALAEEINNAITGC